MQSKVVKIMKKGLTLFFTAIAMFTMCLGACSSNTHSSTSNIPEWSIHEDGHLYHFDEDLGNVVGPKGDKGDAGEQGVAGQDGANGANGLDGKDGADG